MHACSRKLVWGTVLLSVAFGLFPAARTRAAAGEDKAAALEARLQALEERLAEAEQQLAEKDLELSRLREELDLLYGLEATAPPPASPAPAGTPGERPAPAVRSRRAAPPPLPPAVRPRPPIPGLDELLRQFEEDLGRPLPPDFRPETPAPPESLALRRPQLGVLVQALDPEAAKARGIAPETGGAFVLEVLPGTPAAAAGVQPGDVIVGLDGEAVGSPADLRRVVAGRIEEAPARLRLLRDGKELVLEVRLLEPVPIRERPAVEIPDWRALERRHEQALQEMVRRLRELERERAARPASPEPDPLAPEPGAEEPEDLFWPEDELGLLPGGAEEGLVEARVVRPDGSRLGAAVGAPGLSLSDALAQQMQLTDAERARARELLAAARKELAGDLERSLRETGQLGDLSGRITELEARTEQELAGFLKPEQIQTLREARAKTRGRRRELRIELGGGEPRPEDVETVPGSGRTF